MKTSFHLMAAAAAALSAGGAYAGGIERSAQSVNLLFEKGRVAEIGFGSVNPSLSGTDTIGSSTGSVADSYRNLSLGYKADINDRLSWAVILDQPFGADVHYAPSTAGGSVLLGGTKAEAKTTALTALMRARLENGFSLHGGLRLQQASANIELGGAAYGATPPSGLNGYRVNLDRDMALGYVIGAAWERPDIAARVALTYNSEITHKFDTQENISAAPSVTRVKTPRSINLDFQTGVAADTLLFGSIRRVKWSEFRLDPRAFIAVSPAGLINLEDTTTYTLGVGRKFSETWSGSVSVNYEKEGRTLVSPLSPHTGRLGATLAAVYTRDNMKVTTGVNYTRLGDASAQTANMARAAFTGSKAVGVGMKVAFTF